MMIMMNPQVTWMVVVLPARLELEERNPKKLSFPPRSRGWGRPCVPLLDHRHVFCPLSTRMEFQKENKCKFWFKWWPSLTSRRAWRRVWGGWKLSRATGRSRSGGDRAGFKSPDIEISSRYWEILRHLQDWDTFHWYTIKSLDIETGFFLRCHRIGDQTCFMRYVSSNIQKCCVWLNNFRWWRKELPRSKHKKDIDKVRCWNEHFVRFLVSGWKKHFREYLQNL